MRAPANRQNDAIAVSFFGWQLMKFISSSTSTSSILIGWGLQESNYKPKRENSELFWGAKMVCGKQILKQIVFGLVLVCFSRRRAKA